MGVGYSRSDLPFCVSNEQVLLNNTILSIAAHHEQFLARNVERNNNWLANFIMMDLHYRSQDHHGVPWAVEVKALSMCKGNSASVW
jgi:hypothetical protein